MRIQILKQKPNSWAEWDEELARELEKPIASSMFIGATTAQEEIPGKLVDWTLEHPQAQKYIREHALELAKNINLTTQNRIKDALLTGMKLGEGKQQLALRVKDVFKEASTWRSRIIAQSETIRAYSQGSLQLYKEGGIQKKQWLDGQEGSCQECQDLNDLIVDINEGFPGGYDGPPAHVNCRCAIRGVVE